MDLFTLFYNSSGVSIDTRSIKKDCIFIALKGPNFNGSDFIASALANGAKYCITEEQAICDNASVFFTEDTLQFIQQLALYHRRKFSIPIIGITGSNGKTSTKELINCVLMRRYNVLSTIGNLNNHIGVPLTLLQLNASHEIAIIEMGANKHGDIAELCSIAEPNYGVITNIGKAHLEGFKEFNGVLKTKKELYTSVSKHKGVLFFNADDEILVENLPENISTYSYGTDQRSQIIGELIELNPAIKLNYRHTTHTSIGIQTQLIGKYNFYNFLCAISIGVYFKVKDKQIQNAIETYVSTNNRSQVEKTENNTLLIDCYNANPSSMLSALESFVLVHHDDKIAILGDMLELGEETNNEHRKIIYFCNVNKISYLTVGENFAKVNNTPTKTFLTTEELGVFIKNSPLQQKLILLKGSRGIALEKLIPLM
jgi:UDP-N-acetylmuramoyl-tripeptide--D-alanyl-D-alanine ligase